MSRLEDVLWEKLSNRRRLRLGYPLDMDDRPSIGIMDFNPDDLTVEVCSEGMTPVVIRVRDAHQHLSLTRENARNLALLILAGLDRASMPPTPLSKD